MTWGLVAATGVVVNGYVSNKEAKRAANAQENAANTGISETRRQFNTTQDNLQPYQDAGAGAVGQQSALLGLGSPEEQAAAFAAFENSPGQSFLRNQQERSLLRNSAATGNLGGGNVKTALQEQAYGRASTNYNNYFSQLGQVAGQGQAATTTAANLGAQSSSNIANLQASGGQARASGILGQQQANASTVNSLTGLAAQGGMFNSQSPSTDTTPYTAWT